jgi:hypothetical protein
MAIIQDFLQHNREKHIISVIQMTEIAIFVEKKSKWKSQGITTTRLFPLFAPEK